MVYTLSYQLENGTVVFTLNKEFVITNAITNIFDEQTNYSVVNNLVNKEMNYYYFDAVPYAADCKHMFAINMKLLAEVLNHYVLS